MFLFCKHTQDSSGCECVQSVYAVEQNIKVSSSYVYHWHYFTHKLTNLIIEPHRKISKQPMAN